MSKTKINLVVAILLFETIVGSATGVQRTVLSSYSSSLTRYLGLAFLPLAFFGIFKGVMGLTGGFVSDRLGRKIAMVLGSLAYLIGVIVILKLERFEALLLGNLLIGAGEGLVFTAAMASISDVLGAEEAARSFGFMEGFAYGGYGIGAVIAGSIWAQSSAIHAFRYSLIAALVSFFFAVFLIKETKPLIKEEKRYEAELNIQKNIRRIFSYPSLSATYIVAHLSKLADALVWALLPLYLINIGYRLTDIGAVEGAFIFSWAFTMPFIGGISDRIGRKPLATVGLALSGLTLILFLYVQNPGLAVLVAILAGLGYGMYYPVLPAMTADLAPLDIKATALGLYRGFRDSGYFTGAILLGLLTEYLSVSTTFYLTAAVMFMGSMAALTVIRETRPSWPFFELVVNHMTKIRECLEIQRDVLKSIFNNDLKGAERANSRIKDLEREADVLKREVMGKIWSSTLPIGDRMDFERLVETIDRMAGALLESNERLMRLRGKIEEDLQKELLEMHSLLMETADRFIENLKAIRTSPTYALILSDNVEKSETKVDVVRRRIMELIRSQIEEERMDILTAIDLRDAVDLLEMIADDLEDASDIIRIVCYKHM